MRKLEIIDFIKYEDIKDGQIVKFFDDDKFYMMVQRKLKNQPVQYWFFPVDVKHPINASKDSRVITNVFDKYGEEIKRVK